MAIIRLNEGKLEWEVSIFWRFLLVVDVLFAQSIKLPLGFGEDLVEELLIRRFRVFRF